MIYCHDPFLFKAFTILMYGCSADDRLSELRDALCVVSSNGEVLWIPTSLYKSACSIDITNFPFDSQICHLKFGSWSYDGFKVDIDFYQVIIRAP